MLPLTHSNLVKVNRMHTRDLICFPIRNLTTELVGAISHHATNKFKVVSLRFNVKH